MYSGINILNYKILRIYSHMMFSQQFTTIKEQYITTIITIHISKDCYSIMFARNKILLR